MLKHSSFLRSFLIWETAVSSMPGQKKFLTSLILASLIIGLFWAINHWSMPLESDEVVYYQLGTNLFLYHQFLSEESGQLDLTMSRPPLYPGLIALFHYLNLGHPNYLRIFQIFLFAAIVILVYSIARLVFNQATAKIASVLTLFFPALGILTGLILTEITFIFFLLLGLFFLVLLFKKEKTTAAVWSGLFFGLSVLTRPVLLLFPFFLIIVLLVFQIRSLLRKSLLLLLVFVLVVSPWLIRNYFNFKQINISDVGSLMLYNRAYRLHYYSWPEIKHFILLNTLNSYLAKKVDPSFDYQLSKFEPHVYRLSPAFGDASVLKKSPFEQRKLLFQEAKEIIPRHPIKYLAFGLLEIFRVHTPLLTEFSTMDLFAGTHQEIPPGVKILIILLIKIVYLVFFVIVLFGIFSSLKRSRLALPLLAVLLYTLLLFCSMETIPRYSIPLYPLYFIFFGFALLRIIGLKPLLNPAGNRIFNNNSYGN